MLSLGRHAKQMKEPEAHAYVVFLSVSAYVFCRTAFPPSAEATMRTTNTTQTYQLWASVSSALCGCVNNPQNGNVILCHNYERK